MWKLNLLLPCAATILTLAIAPHAQGQLPAPTSEITEFELTAPNSAMNLPPPVISDGSGLTGNGAIQGENLSVPSDFGETPFITEATVYRFCFDYGFFDDIYASGRTDICERFDYGTDTFTGEFIIDDPAFDSDNLPSEDFAFLAAGVSSSITNFPQFSNSVLQTALETSFGPDPEDRIVRVLGNDFDPFLSTFNPLGTNQVFIPYLNGSGQLRGVSLDYSPGTNTWDITTGATIEETGTDYMFVRFQKTGTKSLVLVIPEPSGLFGIFLASFSVFLTIRRS